MDLERFASASSPRLLSVLRIVAALLFLQHGTAKLLGVPPMGRVAKLDLLTLPGIAGLFELVGGILLVLGFWTRPVAFVLSGMMAVAYFYAHAKQSFFPIVNQGELAVLYCFVFLYIAAAGGGAFSLDGRHKPKR
jgi:putative oxidoreductase